MLSAAILEEPRAGWAWNMLKGRRRVSRIESAGSEPTLRAPGGRAGEVVIHQVRGQGQQVKGGNKMGILLADQKEENY